MLLADDRLVIYSRPTNRYEHAVLGDDLKAGGMVLLETTSRLIVRWQVNLDVGEDIAPIWADLDGDSRREIVATLSDAGQGASLAGFIEDRPPLDSGDAIGQGFRWRHQDVGAKGCGHEARSRRWRA